MNHHYVVRYYIMTRRSLTVISVNGYFLDSTIYHVVAWKWLHIKHTCCLHVVAVRPSNYLYTHTSVSRPGMTMTLEKYFWKVQGQRKLQKNDNMVSFLKVY